MSQSCRWNLLLECPISKIVLFLYTSMTSIVSSIAWNVHLSITSSSTVVISYTILAPAVSKRESDPKKSAQGILETIQLDTELYRIGNTKACLHLHLEFSLLLCISKHTSEKKSAVFLFHLSLSLSTHFAGSLTSLACCELCVCGSLFQSDAIRPLFKVRQTVLHPTQNKTIVGLFDYHRVCSPVFQSNNIIWNSYLYTIYKQLLSFTMSLNQIQNYTQTRRTSGTTFWTPTWPRELKMKRKHPPIFWTLPSSMRPCSDWVTPRHVDSSSFASGNEHSNSLDD